MGAKSSAPEYKIPLKRGALFLKEPNFKPQASIVSSNSSLCFDEAGVKTCLESSEVNREAEEALGLGEPKSSRVGDGELPDRDENEKGEDEPGAGEPAADFRAFSSTILDIVLLPPLISSTFNIFTCL